MTLRHTQEACWYSKAVFDSRHYCRLAYPWCARAEALALVLLYVAKNVRSTFFATYNRLFERRRRHSSCIKHMESTETKHPKTDHTNSRYRTPLCDLILTNAKCKFFSAGSRGGSPGGE